jgi:signal transduction histidine kinase
MSSSMSAGAQRLSQGAVLSRENAVLPHERSPLQHLLHALNQPLTGLQCSIELALGAPRTPEQYTRTLRDGIDLTARMRLLVEALRELADIERESEMPAERRKNELTELSLAEVLREAVQDLRPVAESKGVEIRFAGDGAFAVRGARRTLAAVLFRFLESVVSLSAVGGAISVAIGEAQSDALSNEKMRAHEGKAEITVGWSEPGKAPEYSPFSRPELGLMIAQAAWKQGGGEWSRQRDGRSHTLILRWPLAWGEAR